MTETPAHLLPPPTQTRLVQPEPAARRRRETREGREEAAGVAVDVVHPVEVGADAEPKLNELQQPELLRSKETRPR